MSVNLQKKDASAHNAVLKSVSIRSVAEVFLFIAAIVFILKLFVLEFFLVESSSMTPSLQKGDVVLISRISYFAGFSSRIPFLGIISPVNGKIKFRNINKGDVVIFDEALIADSHSKKILVKRITGAPGDSIFVGKSNLGKSFQLRRNTLNDNIIASIIPGDGDTVALTPENYVLYKNIIINEGNKVDIISGKILINGKECSSYVCRDNHYFVAGDNQSVSRDSGEFGLIPESSVQGRAIILIASSSKEKEGFFDRFLRLL